jgi:hypothetical protein
MDRRGVYVEGEVERKVGVKANEKEKGGCEARYMFLRFARSLTKKELQAQRMRARQNKRSREGVKARRKVFHGYDPY